MKPTEDFFYGKKFDEKNFVDRAKKNNFVVIKLKIMTDKQEGDIAGTKMKKFFRYFIDELERKQQKIAGKNFSYGGKSEAVAFLSLKLNKVIEIRGPKKNMEDALKSFKRVRKNIYFKNGFAFAKENFSFKDFVTRKQATATEMGVGFDWTIL
jgi:tRNA nucleotidyltransferase (CCA-adding enzyme)